MKVFAKIWMYLYWDVQNLQVAYIYVSMNDELVRFEDYYDM